MKGGWPRRPGGPVRLMVHSVLAAVLLVAAAIWRFDVPAADVLQVLLACLIGLALLIALAALTGWLLRKLRSR